MGELLYFAETTLLWMVSVFFLTGIVTRSLFFVVNIFRSRPFSRRGALHRFVTLFGVFAPFHRAVLKRPVYTAIRYLFHACLFILPIWFSGHVSLWEESRFEWYWTPLPDEWADWMTLAILATCAFFLTRRMVLKNRHDARFSDFILILITALPFLTGYFLTHDTLNSIPFFDTYLWYMHVISGEIMLILIVFLFYRTRLRKETCVGCAACVENCPTETLEFYDKDALRFFRYSQYQCICCGSCVNVCPENAATLSHAISIKHFMRMLSKDVIRDVELARCDRCGVTIAPEPQMAKLEGILSANDVEMALFNHCDRCRKIFGRDSILLPAAAGFFPKSRSLTINVENGALEQRMSKM